MLFLFVFNSISHSWDIELNTQREIPHLQATMYKHLTYKKKSTRCHSFMALRTASDMSEADWLPQAHVRNDRKFSRVVVRFSSVVQIPIKHSSLPDNWFYQSSWFRYKRRITTVKGLERWCFERLPIVRANEEGLTLEASAFQMFHGGNSTFINSFW